jgi:anti-sigma regulatory factor (Ser/Thr protein kinase)
MTAPPPGSLLASAREGEQVIVRCLYEKEPEHHARDMVTGILPQLGLGETFEAELAISELVANARRHAPGPYELRLYLAATGVKIAVVDGGNDHAELAQRLLQAAAEESTAEESGRGLQLVAGLFPGRCGAEPTTTCVGLSPAKQLWITVPGDGDLWKECDVTHLNETERQAVQLSNDVRERIDRWLATRHVMGGSLAVSPYVDSKAEPSVLITANAYIARALVMSLDERDQQPGPQPPTNPAQDGWPYPEGAPHRPAPLQ